MFHPTIGQCSPKSLSNTATPELGMIPKRNKELSRLIHSQRYTTIHSQANVVGFIKPSGSWGKLTAKLVGSLKS